MLRLLPKSEIQKRKTEEHRQSIDEGVKLAKRIEALRETASIEEQNLEQFRRKTVERIHTETREAQKVLDAVLVELNEARSQRDEALIPLDAEWAVVNSEKQKLEHDYNFLRVKCEETERASAEATNLLKSAEGVIARAVTREDAAIRAVEDALLMREEAVKLVTEATSKSEESVILKESIELTLNERKRQLDSKEEQLNKKDALLEQERVRQIAERVRLTDREQTLEREFKRLTKKQ